MVMNKIPGRPSLASRVHECNNPMLTTSEYNVSRQVINLT